MKFMLVVTICSAVMQICTQPTVIDYHDDWYHCSTAGYEKAKELNQIIGKQSVNYEQTIINFQCKEVGQV